MRKVDSLIIGAGFSGLAAGIRLAGFQEKVLIVEAHDRPGGLNSYYNRKAFASSSFSSGLHTFTNFDTSSRRWGLGMVARYLGISAADFHLAAPRYNSAITLADFMLEFGNDPEVLRESVSRFFPASADAFAEFVSFVLQSSTDFSMREVSAREVLQRYFAEPEIRDALAMPVFFYGGYSEGDIDFFTFSIIFRSIFLDGCSAPQSVENILQLLTEKFTGLGGEIVYNSKVKEINCHDSAVQSAVLQNGEVITAADILSSAGLVETGRLAGYDWGEPGVISTVESTLCYDRPLAEAGVRHTLNFVCRKKEFEWKAAEEDCFDLLSISVLDNYSSPVKPEHQIKIACFDSCRRWEGYDRNAYREHKLLYAQKLLENLEQLYPGLGQIRPVYQDVLTPLTIRRYTAHVNGTIYGGLEKAFDGRTEIRNLYIIGNDQGMIGIVGALVSGIVIANNNVILS